MQAKAKPEKKPAAGNANPKKRTRNEAFGADKKQNVTHLMKENSNAEERALVIKKMPFFTELSKPDSRMKDFEVTKNANGVLLKVSIPPGVKIEQKMPLLSDLSLSNLSRVSGLKLLLKNTLSSNAQAKNGVNSSIGLTKKLVAGSVFTITNSSPNTILV